ncbi:hypothetical protein [Saccharopolyspora antimicrobica]|uniref:hypothetical protein n=1 Tax=Saccharopolyspora antimicrobica TaxID=455193 RepID=UPI000EB5F926|nr:hypothetical protein [Saccharopolyspora antimicrobica]
MSANVHDGDDFAWMDTSPGEGDNIGEIYCLTFVKGIGVSEALERIGGVPSTFATRTFSDIEETRSNTSWAPRQCRFGTYAAVRRT